jgi:hypothetical protein
MEAALGSDRRRPPNRALKARNPATHRPESSLGSLSAPRGTDNTSMPGIKALVNRFPVGSAEPGSPTNGLAAGSTRVHSHASGVFMAPLPPMLTGGRPKSSGFRLAGQANSCRSGGSSFVNASRSFVLARLRALHLDPSPPARCRGNYGPCGTRPYQWLTRTRRIWLHTGRWATRLTVNWLMPTHKDQLHTGSFRWKRSATHCSRRGRRGAAEQLVVDSCPWDQDSPPNTDRPKRTITHGFVGGRPRDAEDSRCLGHGQRGGALGTATGSGGVVLLRVVGLVVEVEGALFGSCRHVRPFATGGPRTQQPGARSARHRAEDLLVAQLPASV